MPDRKRLVSTLCITSSLALLAWVLIVPIRMSGFVTVSSRPDCRPRNFVLAAACLSAATVTDDVQQEDALASDDEEPDTAVALHQARVSFLFPGSFRKLPDRQPIAPPSILSFYPLRF